MEVVVAAVVISDVVAFDVVVVSFNGSVNKAVVTVKKMLLLSLEDISSAFSVKFLLLFS